MFVLAANASSALKLVLMHKIAPMDLSFVQPMGFASPTIDAVQMAIARVLKFARKMDFASSPKSNPKTQQIAKRTNAKHQYVVIILSVRRDQPVLLTANVWPIARRTTTVEPDKSAKLGRATPTQTVGQNASTTLNVKTAFVKTVIVLPVARTKVNVRAENIAMQVRAVSIHALSRSAGSTMTVASVTYVRTQNVANIVPVMQIVETAQVVMPAPASQNNIHRSFNL